MKLKAEDLYVEALDGALNRSFMLRITHKPTGLKVERVGRFDESALALKSDMLKELAKKVKKQAKDERRVARAEMVVDRAIERHHPAAETARMLCGALEMAHAANLVIQETTDADGMLGYDVCNEGTALFSVGWDDARSGWTVVRNGWTAVRIEDE